MSLVMLFAAGRHVKASLDKRHVSSGFLFWRVCILCGMAGWAGTAPFGWPAGLVVLRAAGLVLGTTLVLRYGVHRGGASRQPVGWHTRPGAPPCHPAHCSQ